MDDNTRVGEWESGLPTTNDLTPLSQALISPELASAFSITAEPYKNMVDVNRASQTTIENIRRQNSGFCTNTLKSFMEDRSLQEEEEEENDDGETEKEECLNDRTRKIQRIEAVDEGEWDESSAKASKRARLVWTPQLHKRFVDVVAHLGIKKAVPKNIMQLMNVEGLTRENVASHLQKYRLYLKRMQGLTNEPPSVSDKLFSSTPVPKSLCEGNGTGTGTGTGTGFMSPAGPMAFAAYGAVANVGMVHGHMGMSGGNGVSGGYHPYNMYTEQQGDWSANRFGSVVPYSHDNHNNK